MKKIYFLLFLGLFFPYWLFGIDYGNSVLLLGGICVLIGEKTLRIRRSEMLLAVGLSILGIMSIFRSYNMNNSMEGLSLYLALPIFIALFRTHINEITWRDGAKWFSYGVLLSAILSIGISFFFQASRLEGFMNYSNTYGLLLLIGYIFYRCFGERKILTTSAEIILLWGILMTGSRTTLGLLGVYILVIGLQTIRKKKPAFLFLYLGASIGLYVLYELSKPWALFAFILVLTGDYLFKPEALLLKKIKKPNGGILTFVVVSMVTFIFTNSSLLNRIKEISMETGVLQERFIIYQDALKSILRGPLGYGINSFPYLQYYNQTAFYDVRYIHNAVLQVGFDLGLLGLVVFCGLFFLWAKEVFRHLWEKRNMEQDSEKEIRLQMAFVFGIIVGHSLLDFDLSYFLLYIPFLLITTPRDGKNIFMVTLIKDKKPEAIKRKGERELLPFVLRGVLILCGLVTVYSLSVSTLFMLGEASINSSNYDQGIKLLKIGELMAPRNGDFYILEAQAYYLRMDEETEVFCKKSLEAAAMRNSKDLRIYVNMGFLYKKTGDYNAMVDSFKKAVAIQKYNPELYERSIQAINEFAINHKGNGRDKKSFLADEKWFIEKRFESAKGLNPNAKYLRNQLNRNQLGIIE